MKALRIREFGDPLLRRVSKNLKSEDIDSDEIQSLIKEMRHILLSKKLGVALAAPQVGQSLALAVIAVRPTEHRPDVEEFDAVIINPVIKRTFGKPKSEWEGCISSGHGQANLFGKVARFGKIEVTYMDENAKKHTNQFEGLVAQIIQHETDHMNGILFVDHVTDSKTFATMQEYKKLIKK